MQEAKNYRHCDDHDPGIVMFDGMKLDLGRSAEPIKRMSLSGQINMLKVDG